MSRSGTVPSSQSTIPQGTLQVIIGSEYLKRQEKAKHTWAVRLMLPIVVLWLASLIIGLGVLGAAIAPRIGLAEVSLPPWAGGAALAMILLDFALMPLLDRLVQERDQYRQGLEGEEATAKALQQYLDGRWTLFRNVVLPGDRADIDGVLVGPAGVFCLEIKSYSGRFRNRGYQWWWRRHQPAWQRLSSNPSRQAKANAARLSEYLQKAIGQKEWVKPRVVWVGPGKLDYHKPAVYIWSLEEMATHMDELNRLPAGRGNAMQRVRGALAEVMGAEGKGQDG